MMTQLRRQKISTKYLQGAYCRLQHLDKEQANKALTSASLKGQTNNVNEKLKGL